MSKKIGVNDPCPCGALREDGKPKKYKKCCLDKDKNPPVPQEVIDYFMAAQAEQEYFKKAGLHNIYVKPILFQEKKVWAIGNRVYPDRPVNETYHQFILGFLAETLGKDWWIEQNALSSEEKHFIALCFEKLNKWAQQNEATAERINDGTVWGATPNGYCKALLSLAFDVSSLAHTNKLPDQLLNRLRSKEAYQGARYEIAIAAIFSRLNCDIEFTDENSKSKHCEFIATHRETGSVLAVEAKSKRRDGIIHEPGTPEPVEEQLSGEAVRRLFNEALKQNPKDVPFAVFVDLNSPLTPEIPVEEKPWVKEVKHLMKSKLKNLREEDYPLNAAFFTNFSYHYQTENESLQGESMGFVIPHPKFAPPSPEFFGYIEGALTHYGFVPSIGINEKLD